MTPTEAEIQSRIMLAIGSNPAVRIFRNNVGQAWTGDVTRAAGAVIISNPRPVQFGLHKGSPDLVGWKTVTVTPDMVGWRVALFAGLEVKTPRGATSTDQDTFLAAMRAGGCVGGVVRSADDAKKLLRLAGT